MAYEVISLPPDLSPQDASRDRELRNELAKLHREYQDRSAPILEQLAGIQARYLPRIVLVPKADSTEATKSQPL